MYQEFWDIFANESLMNYPAQKQWDHAIELVTDAQKFQH